MPFESDLIMHDVLHTYLNGSVCFLDTTEDIRKLFGSFNVDNGKEIHFNEFLAATLGKRALDERRLRLAFDRLDYDHNGTIDGEHD